LVGLPTETVYGLAADATNPVAVAAIYAAKGRPQFNPLIAHVLGAADAAREAMFCDRATALARAFWPGPLTLVLPRQKTGAVCDLACAGLATIGVRAPAHLVARALIAAVGRPLAAPSANPSGRISPTSVQHLRDDALPGLDIVLDGGASALGLESSIVAVLPNKPLRLLREGAIPRATLEAIAGPLAAASEAVSAPGMLASHYAPRARLRLNALGLESGEYGIGFARYLRGAAMDLSPDGNLTEAAARLYGALRAADASGATIIAVAPIPEHGLGAAINDRLRRAAARD
jgi:L-threonylcarbamoyladenylate synthase